MGIRTGAAKCLQEEVSHLVPVHCCAHRVELAIKSVSEQVDYFKTLEDTLHSLYLMYHRSPKCQSELKQVGETHKVRVLMPVKVQGTRWIAHRESSKSFAGWMAVPRNSYLTGCGRFNSTAR